MTRERNIDAPAACFEPEHLRELCWRLGTRFPPPFRGGDRLAFAVVHPRLAYLHWHLDESSVQRLAEERGDRFHGARLVVRLYDVTDVIFDGFNAHMFFDLDIDGLSGTRYLPNDRMERNLLGEVGFRLQDGSFDALARSATVRFDRDRPSGRFQLEGLYVGRGFKRVFPVGNVIDAPVYERLNVELADLERDIPLRVAVVYEGAGGGLDQMIGRLADGVAKLKVEASRFGGGDGGPADGDAASFLADVEARAAVIAAALRENHQRQPFDLIHAHDWYSVPAVLQANSGLDLPLVLSLHSTEHERAHGTEIKGAARAICAWEQRGVEAARLVLVPSSSTRQQVITLYGASEQQVMLLPDVFEEGQQGLPDPGEARRQLGIAADHPVVLFASEVSHAAGADLLMDALIPVSREHGTANFVFAGDGPLRGELEGRAWHAGVGHRCRFVGDVSAESFEWLLIACDFVVIPARTWQDEGLARMATGYGKPVLTTHQSHIQCINHGENGLLTYDNPGSIVWGLKELLNNPLHGSMLRLFAKQRAGHTQSLESVVAEHALAYEKALAASAQRDDDG